MTFSASPEWNQCQTVGGDSAAKHQMLVLWGPAAIMSLPLGSVEGHRGWYRMMRAKHDNMMEHERQSWCGNAGRGLYGSGVVRKSWILQGIFLYLNLLLHFQLSSQVSFLIQVPLYLSRLTQWMCLYHLFTFIEDADIEWIPTGPVPNNLQTVRSHTNAGITFKWLVEVYIASENMDPFDSSVGLLPGFRLSWSIWIRNIWDKSDGSLLLMVSV